MKEKVRMFLIQHKYLVIVFNFLMCLKNKKKVEFLEKSQESSDFFDFMKLAKETPYFPDDYVIDNNMYGISSILKKYCDYSGYTDVYCEHGVFWGDYLQSDQLDWFTKSIVVMGPSRQEHLQNMNIRKKVVPIGPYIHYAESFLSKNEFSALKQKLGKVLLIFPPHSTKSLEVDYDMECFINMVEEKKAKFDTVLVCMYWLDCHDEKLVKLFKSKNYLITTAGHKFNKKFLNRLRSIIEVSDMTISTSIGTHLGYCISLNKPHFVFDSGLKYKNRETKNDHNYDNNYLDKYMFDIGSVFSEYNESISTHQIKVVEQHWGLSKILSPSDLLEVLISK